MSFRLPQGFSFFGGSSSHDLDKAEVSKIYDISPSLKLLTDKEFYRTGDLITFTLEISIPESSTSNGDYVSSPFLVDNLSFEIKGVEKLDPQWFSVQKPQPGSKLKRGEQLLLDSTTSTLVSKVIFSPGCFKAYLVRAELPKNLPPSYRGTTIRYIYYARSILCGRWLAMENGHHNGVPINNPIQVEARIPLTIWITQRGNMLLNQDSQIIDLFPMATVQIDAYWKEKNADSEWIRSNDVLDGLEDEYDSSRDETSSVSSYMPYRSIDNNFRNSVLPLSASRLSLNETRYCQGETSDVPSHPMLSQLSVAEVTDKQTGGVLLPQKKLSSYPSVLSPIRHSLFLNSPFSSDDGGCSIPGGVESATSEGFIRGRSYNIRIDDQVLLRFSPKNSDSTYYFGDMIGGTLTIFHGEGERRCLEVGVMLEISEIISQQFVHPSRRNSPKITKIQSDHHEVVADLAQTSFLFSIPMDGPMSFSSPYVSVEWALRFEFFTTPEGVDWTRYEHPLIVERRERGEWVLPIVVNAPPQRNHSAASSKTGKLFSLGNMGLQN